MALQSMTGFARQEGAHANLSWVWELRSVNGKGLDIRLRLPQGYEYLEPRIREALKNAFQRGNIQISLTVSRESEQVEAVINRDVLKAIMHTIQTLGEEVQATPPSWDGLLAVRGVLELRESRIDDDTVRAEEDAILASLNSAVGNLLLARRQEGHEIESGLKQRLNEIDQRITDIDADPSRTPESIRSRIADQVRLLMDTNADLDTGRLHQEAAMLAAKADLREELDRLRAHVAAGNLLFGESGPVGRRLDFLAQEFNREANTICSKSNAAVVTALGLELKVIIDQFREQVQNVE
jgi:uncharacterized protein (TIGR00255 family)